MPSQPYADDLDWISITDFRAGIWSKEYKAAAAGLATPSPPGAAQLSNTFACIALPSGGLAPLPKVTATYTVPLPDTDGNASLGYFNVDGFTAFGPVGPPAVNPSGNVDDFFFGIEYLKTGGANRVFTYYRVDPIVGSDPFPSDQLLQVTSTQNPTSEQYMGLSFAISRMYTSAGGTGLFPGTPVVVTAWAPPGFAADRHVVCFPNPSAANATGILELCTNRPTSDTPAETNVGDILGHQGRIVMLEYLTNPFGARAGDSIPTNEQISFSDPANTFNSFGGGSPYTIGTQRNVFGPEYPNGYGAWGSISNGELFLIKQQGGGLIVSGDLASPTIIRLPGVVSTGGIAGRAASTPQGLFYFARYSGVYIWRGADTSEKISQPLEDDFMVYSPAVDKMLDIAVQIQEWADWVVTSNGYLYDTVSGGWWRLDNPATYTPHWFARGYFADLLYAIPLRLNNTTKTGAIRQYSRRTPASTWSWNSQPITQYANRMHQTQEVAIEAEGAGTIQITLQRIDGTTDNQNQVTFTLPAQAASQRVRLRQSLSCMGYAIVPLIVATGSGGNAAPTLHALHIGCERQQIAVAT